MKLNPFSQDGMYPPKYGFRAIA